MRFFCAADYGDNIMDKKEAYRKKFEAQLKEWKATIDQLENRAASLSSEARNELVREIEELRRQKVGIREKWNDRQKTGGEAWDKMKDGLEKAAAELKESLGKALSRFNK